MSDQSLNETGMSATQATNWIRRLPLKTVVLVVVALVLMGHTSQAIKQRFEGDEAGTILPARIRAARVFSIVGRLPGRVLSISAALGDKVQPGQELAKLEDPELTLELERARTRLARADERKRVLSNRNPGNRILAEQYRAAQAARKSACTRANDFNIGDLERRYYDEARARTKGVEELVAGGLATSAELDRSQREEGDALRALTAGRVERSRLQQECDTSLAQVRVTKLQQDLNRRSEVESAEAEYADALAQVNTLSEQLKGLRVIAERPGTVLAVPVAVGDRVTAGAALFQVADLSELSVEVPVGGRIARQIRKGDKVRVRLPMDPPRQVEASVASVLLTPGEDTQSYLVRVLIPNPDPLVILAGLEGEVVFRHSRDSE
jgi:HlyD family secretion protein